MKKIRIVLIALSALYVLVTIILLLNDESLFNRFNLLNLISYLQAWIIVGLILLVGVIVAGSMYIQSLKKQHSKLEKEYNAVKARLYDIEEERKSEISRRQAEEEDTERKLNAFNQSLKGREKGTTQKDDGENLADPDSQKPDGYEGSSSEDGTRA